MHMQARSRHPSCTHGASSRQSPCSCAESTTRRNDAGCRRSALGAVNRKHWSSSVSRSDKLNLSVAGSATALPSMMPEAQICNVNGLSTSGSKMMGVLTFAFLGPLQDCTSFRRLREATARMNRRSLRDAQKHGCSHPHRINEMSIVSETGSPSNARPCEEARTPGFRSEAWSNVTSNGGAAVRQALIDATTRQCCRLLRRGWESIDAAFETVPILVDLREDGLLKPLGEVQAATLDALQNLLKASRPSAAIQLDVQQWSQQAKLFAHLSELSLLPPHASARANQLFESELRRCLRAPTPQDLRRVAHRLAEGGAWLARAAAAPCTQDGLEYTPTELLKPSHASNDDVLPEFVCEIVTVALRTATEADRTGPAALAARDALQRVGIVDVSEEFPYCADMVIKEPRRCSSAPGFRQVDFREVARREKKEPTVLEDGLSKLEAAKAIIRESRLPPGSVQSRGLCKR